MLVSQVTDYLSTARGLPFFYVVGDVDYLPVLEELKQAGFSVVKMSDFCSREDKFPSVDDLVDFLQTSDVNYRDNRFVVVGLGEYLALKGSAFAAKELGRLKNTTIGSTRAILLLRGVHTIAERIVQTDNKMVNQRRAYFSENPHTNIFILNVPEDPGLFTKPGIKYLLAALEEGATGTVYVRTALLLDNALFPTQTLESPYLVVKHLIKNFPLESDFGTKEQWQHLLEDLKKNQNSLEKVFKKSAIEQWISEDLDQAINGLEYRNWLAFLYLKLHVEQIPNQYLRLVVDTTRDFQNFKTALLLKITEFSHKDPDFDRLYRQRKKLLKNFREDEIAVFVKANEVDPEESIYRLTDNTLLERKTIIKWIAHYGPSEAISTVYPALDEYLERYDFTCPLMAEELTEYFDLYKHLKVENRISDEFMKLVEKYASDYSYAKLPSRDSAIKAVADKKDAYLYWIDALGVEYLSYISALARKKGLSVHTQITRCDLPSITTINRGFFDQWKGGKKYKEETLDHIKHKDSGGYFFTNDEDPIHIPAELKVVEDALNIAAMELSLHHCKSFVIAADHGASRLAVIKKQEVPYDTDTKGEHSGRCCKTFEGCDVACRIEENGFIVLSDYGRFRGSRAANVEVHGGASLEEVVVPVITLTLRRQTKVEIVLLNKEEIVADKLKGVTLNLYISDVESPDEVHILVEEQSYPGESLDDNHYVFRLEDIRRRRNKPYTAEVFDGSDLVGSVAFMVKGKTAKVKDDFDFD